MGKEKQCKDRGVSDDPHSSFNKGKELTKVRKLSWRMSLMGGVEESVVSTRSLNNTSMKKVLLKRCWGRGRVPGVLPKTVDIMCAFVGKNCFHARRSEPASTQEALCSG